MLSKKPPFRVPRLGVFQTPGLLLAKREQLLAPKQSSPNSLSASKALQANAQNEVSHSNAKITSNLALNSCLPGTAGASLDALPRSAPTRVNVRRYRSPHTQAERAPSESTPPLCDVLTVFWYTIQCKRRHGSCRERCTVQTRQQSVGTTTRKARAKTGQRASVQDESSALHAAK